MAGDGIDGDSVTGVEPGDWALRLERIEIEREHLVAARHVKMAVGAVRIDIINAARPHQGGSLDNLVRSGGGLAEGQRNWRCDGKREEETREVHNEESDAASVMA